MTPSIPSPITDLLSVTLNQFEFSRSLYKLCRVLSFSLAFFTHITILIFREECIALFFSSQG